MPSVFLSHSSKDKAFTRKLASELTNQGIKVWLDEAEINVGDSLLHTISTAIEDTDFIAVILSHNSINSKWVQVELQLAMGRELADRKIRVLPILIESCEIPAYLKHKLYADFSDPNNFNVGIAQILKAIGVEKTLAEIDVSTGKKDEPKKHEPVSSEELQGFVDIRIIDVDKERTYNPDPDYALYNIYLKLSARPTREWVDIFDAERRFPRHTMWREAWIEGSYIVVNCAPDEVKKYHLRDLREDVETTNNKYRDNLHREAIRKAREYAREEKEKKSLDNALDDLDF